MYSEILRATGTYHDDDVLLFEREVKVRRPVQHELLLRKGEVAGSLYYLLDGAVCQYDLDSVGVRKITGLYIAGDWFLNYESLVGQRPSETFIEAFTGCSLLELSLPAIHYLTGKSLAFLQLNKVLEGAFARMHVLDRAMTPPEKYRFILNHHPGLIRAFPLKMLASYLQITPETLSRVRNLMSRGAIS